MCELSYSLVLETLVMLWHGKSVDVRSQGDSVTAFICIFGQRSFNVYNKTCARALDYAFILNTKSLQNVNYLLLGSKLFEPSAMPMMVSL